MKNYHSENIYNKGNDEKYNISCNTLVTDHDLLHMVQRSMSLTIVVMYLNCPCLLRLGTQMGTHV